MLFNSLDFVLFFVAFATLFFVLRPKFRWLLLLAGSYFFYMFWKWEFIFLIIISTLIDYYCGRAMSLRATQKERKPFLLISLCANLGILFFFKYFDFFSSSVNAIAGSTFPGLNLILPMGISFYTFQTLAYSIDIYRGNITYEKHLGRFALYVTFFPQLVAGPIERADKLLPQFQSNSQKLDYGRVTSGLTQMLIGFFKKVVVADTISIYVNHVYGSHDLYTGFTLLFATYLFAIQIYCDFSGYTDIAIGGARILGYDLMENFRTPYFSKSITEFWRRWHISLSTWLRDYLYIPLGGNRQNKFLTYRNLMITMLLGGLWHGAAWNFVIWGMLHGLYLAVERYFNYRKFIDNSHQLLRFIGGVLTFHLVCLSWVFFRADNFDQAMSILDRLFSMDYFWNLQIKDTNVFGSIVITTCLLLLFDIFLFRKLDLSNLSAPKNKWSLIGLKVALVILIMVFGISEGSQFIYFQF